MVAQALEFLKAENQMLRAQIDQPIRLEQADRDRLLKLGKPLGTGLRNLITIVSYTTFLAWKRKAEKALKASPAAPRKAGRPPTAEEIRATIIRLAQENDWGYVRIHGELKSLGIKKVSVTTIRNILKEHGLEPQPDRTKGSWHDFLKRHASTLWACDFISKQIWTKSGFVECFMLFYIHIESRRVHLAGVTVNPSAAWMAQQARNTRMFFDEQPHKPVILIRDRDGKFTPQFDDILKQGGVKIKRLPVRSPNLNAFAERWVLSFRRECLDHFIVFGEEHMRHIAEKYVAYYNEVRPHQSLNNEPLKPRPQPPPDGDFEASQLRCQTWLGGLLKRYYRESA